MDTSSQENIIHEKVYTLLLEMSGHVEEARMCAIDIGFLLVGRHQQGEMTDKIQGVYAAVLDLEEAARTLVG